MKSVKLFSPDWQILYFKEYERLIMLIFLFNNHNTHVCEFAFRNFFQG